MLYNSIVCLELTNMIMMNVIAIAKRMIDAIDRDRQYVALDVKSPNVKKIDHEIAVVDVKSPNVKKIDQEIQGDAIIEVKAPLTIDLTIVDSVNNAKNLRKKIIATRLK